MTEAATSLAAAETAWAVERAELEAARECAAMAATAAEVQRQVEAAVAGDLLVCEVSTDLSTSRHWLVNITCACA